MNKRIFFLSFAICIALLGKAQIGEPRNVLSLGANGGVAINSVDFDPTIKQKMHVGPLNDTYSRNVSYLQLPVFARLAWGKEQKGLQFFFQAGPQIGLCIGDSSKRSSQWTTDEHGTPLRPNNVVAQYDLDIERKFDYGIAGGLGLEYNSPVGHFILEGRYYYGLADMFGNSKKDPFARSANGTIHVKLAYLMDLK